MLSLKQIQSFYPKRIRPFKKNMLREYLQYKALDLIFSSKFANFFSFMGGTAIHIIYGIDRFSEDLDFDDLGISDEKFSFLADSLRKSFELEGHSVDTKIVLKGAKSIHLRFKNLLYQEGLSKHKGEVLLIKIDAEPQKYHYSPEKKIINKFDVFSRINVVPESILLAQKICAIFTRSRPMGRDFYDVVYLFGKVKPNMNYLKEKIGTETTADLKAKLLKKCKKLNFKALAEDLRPFVIDADRVKSVIYFKDFAKSL